ncbi:peptidoglycan-binding protein [Sphingomonas sp. R86521]|uniref:peptidoglycan-binding domain-containing protein n=1 Tax=Sphingomonas sp. R86521 TaxID=3093860 RepID=UPI0036D3DD80
MTSESQANDEGCGDLLTRAIDPRDTAIMFLAYPGRRLAAPLQRGDILVDGGRTAIVQDPDLLDRADALRLGADARAPGQYVAVGNDGGALRIAGPDGLLLPQTTVLRRAEDAGQAIAIAAANHAMLRFGSYGPAVRDMQARLNLLGEDHSERDGVGRDTVPLKVDGRFGHRTRQAVGQFQHRALPRGTGRTDGVLDALTWSALVSHNAVPGTQQIAVNQTNYRGSPLTPTGADLPAPLPDPLAPDPPLDPVSAGEQATDVTAADIGTNLAAITVATRALAIGLQPNFIDFNAIAFANTPSKRAIFRQLADARRAQAKAERQLATAQAAGGGVPTVAQARVIAAAERALAQVHHPVEVASAAILQWLRDQGYRHNRATRALQPRKRAAELAVAAARRHRDAAAIAAAELALAPIMTEWTEATAAVDLLVTAFVPLVAITQHHHMVTVDGHTIRLHDNVVAFGTVDARGMEGEADGDTRAVVNARLGQVATGDHLRILTIISQHEGVFSNVNTWDRAVVTFGFIQWTFGEGGNGSLVPLLAEVKRREPQVYHDRLQRYGIDVTAHEVELAGADGSVVRGADAASAIQVDPKLTAIVSRLGVEQAVQDIQILHAIATQITAVRARRVPGHPVTISDVVSSTYGVGVMADRAVNSGTGAVLDSVARALATFVGLHPGIDLSQAPAAARAEPRVVAALAAMDPERAASFAAFSHDRGSFTV